MELTISSKDKWIIFLLISFFLLPAYISVVIIIKSNFLDYIFMSVYFISTLIFMIEMIQDFYIEKLLLKGEKYEKYNLLGGWVWIINGIIILVHLTFWHSIIINNFIYQSIVPAYMLMILPTITSGKGKVYLSDTEMYYGPFKISKSKIKNVKVKKNNLFIDLIDSKNISMKCYRYQGEVVKKLITIEK